MAQVNYPDAITAPVPDRPMECPPDALHDAVLVDWYNEGVVWHQHREVVCVRLCWQLAARRTNGKRFYVTKRFHKSLHKGALLRKWLERWQGQPFASCEALAGIVLDHWLRRPCLLRTATVVRSNGRSWVELLAIEPWHYGVRRFPLQPEGIEPRANHDGPAHRRWARKTPLGPASLEE